MSAPPPVNETDAYNDYGRCMDSETWLTREADQNAIGDTFRGMVQSVPYVGQLMAGLVQDTHTANAVRYCPGAVIDHTVAYDQEIILISLLSFLIVLYLLE